MNSLICESRILDDRSVPFQRAWRDRGSFSYTQTARLSCLFLKVFLRQRTQLLAVLFLYRTSLPVEGLYILEPSNAVGDLCAAT